MYIPAVRPVSVLEVAPLTTVGGVVSQVKVNVAPGFATELALTVALPVSSPVQSTSTISSTAITASQVFEQSITTPCSNSQPLASVTVTVCVPEGRFTAVAVV